ncbi:MAG: VPLPA-CTERM sorting domain-containing protein [Nitrospira sp.]|nr:VPLPA-CTERM sorting domain-containing protein [Nitrospira sp.]MCP9442308.1 VPLPA-CTERM sorting domain-containing protein [Nitrospira sp.]
MEHRITEQCREQCRWTHRIKAHGIKLTVCGFVFGAVFGAGSADVPFFGSPGVGTAAHAQVAIPAEPILSVTIGQEQFQAAAEWNYDQAQDLFTLAGPLTFTHSSGSTFIIQEAGAIPDPVLFFSASATNVSSVPLAYSFAFNVPLTPSLLGPINSHASLGITLTDGLSNGAAVQPVVPGGSLLTSYDLFSNGGSISKNVDIGSLFSILSGTGATTFSANGQLTCGQPCVTMASVLSFTLTPQDTAGFNGRVIQEPVPLPAALWLFGSGVASLLGLARRQRAAA